MTNEQKKLWFRLFPPMEYVEGQGWWGPLVELDKEDLELLHTIDLNDPDVVEDVFRQDGIPN